MQDKFRVHDVACIRTGKYAGLMGTVTDTKDEAGKQTGVRVKVEGVRDDKPVSAHVWLKRSAVERKSNG
jgi:hypothetical protein